MQKRPLFPKMLDGDLNARLTDFFIIDHWRFFEVGQDIYLIGLYREMRKARVHISDPIVGIDATHSCALSRSDCGYYLCDPTACHSGGGAQRKSPKVQYIWDMWVLHNNFNSVNDITGDVRKALAKGRRPMTEQDLDISLPF